MSERWQDDEHVLAGPFAEILRRACDELVEYHAGNRGQEGRGRLGQLLPAMGHGSTPFCTTSRNRYEKLYAERYGCSQRTAARHFSLTFSQPTIPIYIADRIAALVGLPMAYVEATA